MEGKQMVKDAAQLLEEMQIDGRSDQFQDIIDGKD